jgi:hypothetical protein
LTASRRLAVETAIVGLLAFHFNAVPALGDEAALRLRAVAVGSSTTEGRFAIELLRWSTDAERGPLMTALNPPPPPPPVEASAPAAGRGAAGRGGGRGGRGGRGGAAAPASPTERLTTAVKAAPTIGFIWGDIIGYSIKYAWHAPAAGGAERIVLVTDRRLDASPAASAESAEAAEFTVIEMLIDAKGTGEAKTSLTAPVVVDAAAKTLALDGYSAAPALLKVTK